MDNENAIVTAEGKQTELMNSSEAYTLSFVNPADMPDLDAAEVGMSVEQKYYEFSTEGQTVRAVYNGKRFINSKREENGETVYKEIPAIVFQTKEGVFLNAGASLVEQFSNIPAGTPVEITFTGKEKTSSGNKVNKFDVRLLNLRVKTNEIKQTPRPVTNAQPQQIKPSQIVTSYWTKVAELNMTREEGQEHLRQYGGDFADALSALNSPF